MHLYNTPIKTAYHKLLNCLNSGANPAITLNISMQNELLVVDSLVCCSYCCCDHFPQAILTF